jgi:serine/threonine protein kinase
VPIYAYGELDGCCMQLVRGPSLELLNRRRFSPVTAWQILDPISQALDLAHQHGVIHRDIKPGNILVESTVAADGSRGNHVYLADFGLSKIRGASSLTKAGVSVGTPAYMSPEQVLDQKLAPTSDVYSLAVVVYDAAGAGALDAQTAADRVSNTSTTGRRRPFARISRSRRRRAHVGAGEKTERSVCLGGRVFGGLCAGCAGHQPGGT